MCWLCNVRSQQLFGVEGGADARADAPAAMAGATEPAEPAAPLDLALNAAAAGDPGPPADRAALSASLPIAEPRLEC